MDVSVVINTRDRADRLKLVLTALSHQTGLPGAMEVVVVDDGSQQDISPALEGHGVLDIKLIRQPPLGYTVARNVGLETASGALVLCLDDDALFSERLVAAHMRLHLELSSSSIVVGDRFNTYLSKIDAPRNRPILEAALTGDFGPLRRWSRRDYYAAQTLKLFELHPNALPAPWLCFVTRNVSFRREDAAAAGGFDEGFTRWGVDDIELGLRLHKAGVVYRYCAEARVYHLETPLSPDKIDALQASLAYFARKHPGAEALAFREFVFGQLSLEELCATVTAGAPVVFEHREGLTFFRTQR